MTNDLDSIFHQFTSGKISKQFFIQAMHLQHKRLFNYSTFLCGRQIEEISINKDGVIFTTTQGCRFICDVDDQRQAPFESLNFGTYEGPDSEMLLRAMSGAHVFFDIGANIGWYSVHFGSKFPQMRVLSFEPIPETHSRLLHNIQLNRLSNVNAFNFGLSECDSTVELFYSPSGSGAASMVDLLQADDTRKVTVPMKTVDSVATDERVAVDAIKVDVEGAELFVLRGACRVLASDRPIVFCEMLRKWAAKFLYHPNDVIRFMSEFGYSCFHSEHGGIKEIDSVNDQTTATNFFFLHSDRHREIMSFLRG
jgi:FkbM family methyltransferase